MSLTPKLFRRQILDAVSTSTPGTPRCRHAGVCGGCAFQERAYAAQVAAKRAALQQVWATDLPADILAQIDVVAPPNPYEYRTRMDYVATRGRFGLRRRGRFNHVIELEECHLIPPAAFDVARSLYRRAVDLGLPDYDLRSHVGFLRYLVVRRSPDDMLLLAIVTATGDHADQVARLAETALSNRRVVGFHWLLNDRLTDMSFGIPIRHWGAATLPMRVGTRTLHIGPNTFFQNNIHLLLPLLGDIAGQVGRAGRVADLYGGVATIALHLADQVEHVACVESAAESAALASYNIGLNNVGNVAAIEADVEAFLRDQSPDHFDVVVADPPRTGLGPAVCRELLRLRPRRIVYVSCNPLALREESRLLVGAYRLTMVRGYDMFPHTPHLEALAVFDQR